MKTEEGVIDINTDECRPNNVVVDYFKFDFTRYRIQKGPRVTTKPKLDIQVADIDPI